MAYDIDGARAAGLTDEEISSYLSNKHGYNLDGALEAGIGYDEIIPHLLGKDQPDKTFLGGVADAFVRPVKGAASTFLTAGKGVIEDVDALTNLVGADDLIGNDNAATRWMTDAQNSVSEWGDSAYDNHLTQFLEGMGSMAAFAAATALTRGRSAGAFAKAGGFKKLFSGAGFKEAGKAALKEYKGALPFAGFTGAGEAADMVMQARQQGLPVSEGQEDAAAALGTLIGFTEMVPIERFLRGVKASQVGKGFTYDILQKAKRALINGGAEGVQEVTARLMQDAVAKGIYNPDMPIGQSAWQEFIVGGEVGAATDLLFQALSGRRRRVLTRQSQQEEEARRVAEAKRLDALAERFPDIDRQKIAGYLPYLPQGEIDLNDPKASVEAMIDSVENGLGENFPVNRTFQTQQNNDGGFSVTDENGYQYGPTFQTAQEASIFQHAFQDRAVGKSVEQQADMAMDQAKTAYTPTQRFSLREFARKLFHPGETTFIAPQVNAAAGTTIENDFEHEPMTAQQAMEAGVPADKMTASQRINAKRLSKGLPETHRFTLEEVREELGDKYGNLSDYQFTGLGQDEKFNAIKSGDGFAVTSRVGKRTKTGLEIKDRRATPSEESEGIKGRVKFKTMKEAQQYAAYLNQQNGRLIPRSDLMGDEEITLKHVEELLEEKGIAGGLYSPGIRSIADAITGRKPRSDAARKKTQISDLSKADLANLYYKLRSLPNLAEGQLVELPAFGLRPYSREQYLAAKNAIVRRSTGPNRPSLAKVMPSREELGEGLSQTAYNSLKRDLNADESVKSEIDRLNQRTAEQVKADRIKESENKQIEKAAKEVFSKWGLKRAGVSFTDFLRQARRNPDGNIEMGETLPQVDPETGNVTAPTKTSYANYQKALNQIFIAVDAIRSNPRYLQAKKHSPQAAEKMLEQLVLEALGHETLHAMRQADLFTEAEWNTLKEAAITKRNPLAGGMTYFEWALNNYGDIRNEEVIYEEAIAEMINHALTIPSVRKSISQKQKSLVRRAIEFLKGIFKIQDAVGYYNFDQIVNAIQSGELAQRPDAVRSLREAHRANVSRGTSAPDTLEQRVVDKEGFRKWSDNAPTVEDASPDGGYQFKTGQKVVVNAFHGSPEQFTVFDNGSLGSNTGAGSARLGHFAAGTRDTSASYAGKPNLIDGFGWGSENTEIDDDGDVYITSWDQAEPNWWENRESVELAGTNLDGFISEKDARWLNTRREQGAIIVEAKINDPNENNVTGFFDVTDIANENWYKNMSAEDKAKMFEWAYQNEGWREHQEDYNREMYPAPYSAPAVEEVPNPLSFWKADTPVGRYTIEHDGKHYVLKFEGKTLDASRSRNDLEEQAGDHLYNKVSAEYSENILDLYVRMSNPFVHDYKGETYREKSYYDVISKAKKAGHDGVILLNTYDGGPLDNIFVFFEPNQAKSADYNTGTYSRESNDILEQRSPGSYKSLEERGYTVQKEVIPRIPSNVYMVKGPSGEDIATLHINPDPSNGFVQMVQLHDPKLRGQGIGNALYDYAEKDLGFKIKPSTNLSKHGYRMWLRRNPEAVADSLYQWADRLEGRKFWVEGGIYDDGANVIVSEISNSNIWARRLDENGEPKGGQMPLDRKQISSILNEVTDVPDTLEQRPTAMKVRYDEVISAVADTVEQETQRTYRTMRGEKGLAVVKKTFDPARPIHVLKRADILDLLQFGDMPVLLQPEKVYKGMTGDHVKFNADAWRKVPEWLDNPMAVFDSDTVPGSLVFVGPENVDGNPVFMAVTPDWGTKRGKPELKIHFLNTAYDDLTGKKPIGRWLREGYARYLNKRIIRDGESFTGWPTREKIATNRITKEAPLGEIDLLEYHATDDMLEQRRSRVGTTKKYIGAPKDVDTPQKLGGLLRRALRLAREGEYGRFWYEHSSRQILAAVNGNKKEAEKIVSAIAITSPNTPVEGNFQYALQAYAQHKAGDSVWTGQFPSAMVKKLNDAFAGREWSGRKTNNFYNNLMVEIDPSRVQGATIDIWIMRALGYFQESPTDAQYTFAEEELKGLAEKLGWDVHQVQAAIWVAMKSRSQNPRVKRLTEKHSLRKGWIRYDTVMKDGKPKKVRVILDEEKHAENWLKHSMQHKPTRTDKSKAKFDYEDALNTTLAQVSWESIPGRTTGHMPEAHTAPQHVLMDFHVQMSKAFLSPKGHDLLAEYFGIPSPGDFEAPGFFEGRVSPGSQTQLSIPRQYKGAPFGEVQESAEDLIEAYAAARGILLKQDGIGWHRPFFKGVAKKHFDGVEVDIGRPLTPREASDMAATMQKLSGHGMYSPIGTPEGFRMIRWDDLKEDNLRFQEMINTALRRTTLFDTNNKIKVHWFASKNGYLGNNWQEHKDGRNYYDMGRLARRPDLQRRVQNIVKYIKPRTEAVEQEFADRYNWTRNDTLEQRSARLAEPAGRSVVRNQEGITLGPKRVSTEPAVTGVHFGNTPNLQTLDASKWGTGIKGAERKRLSDPETDPRIRRRIYFYAKGDKPIKPEPGLSNNVYSQVFNNVIDSNGEQAQPIKDAINAQERESGRRWPDDEWYNAFEKGVVDAGYDGLFIKPTGVVVILNHDVPVSHSPDMLEQREYDITGKKASFTQSRIDYIFRERGYASGRVIAAAARINPIEFVRATTTSFGRSADIFAETGPLDLDMLREEIQTPFLYISKTQYGDWEIDAHEGRHRMAALAMEGVRSAPVMLINKHTSYEDTSLGLPEDGILKGQRYGHAPSQAGSDITYSRLVDVSEANRKKFEAEYGPQSEADILYQRRYQNTHRVNPMNVPRSPVRTRAGSEVGGYLKSWWDRNFRAQGNLPDAAFAAKIISDQEKGAENLHAEHLTLDFKEAVKKHYGKSYVDLSAAQKRDLNDFLASEGDNIPEALKDKLRPMRDYIDRLSTLAIEEGLVEGDVVDTIMENQGHYLHRSYQVFDDPRWLEKVMATPAWDEAYRYLRNEAQNQGRIGNAPLSQNEAENKALIEGLMMKILTYQKAADDVGFLMTNKRLGQQDLKMLVRRKQIAEPIRKLMGEYEDPVVNFSKTATKIQYAVANHVMLKNIMAEGLGTFLHRNPVPEATYPLSQFNRLNEGQPLYASQEVANAFVEALDPKQFGEVYRHILMLNGAVKYGKTVLSVTTMARNVLSAFYFSMANGHVMTPSFFKEFKKSFMTLRGELKNRTTQRQYYEDLKRLGVTLDNPFPSEMIGAMNDAINQDAIHSKGIQGAKKFFGFFTKMYQYGDDLWKIVGFESEKAALARAGMSTTRNIKVGTRMFSEAEIEAASRIRDTYPTYSLIGKQIKRLRRFPLMGTFVSFPAEIIRTSVNIARTLKSDIDAGRTEMVARRIAGMSVAAGWAAVVTALTKAMMGFDDDDDETIRKLSAPWMRNSNLAYAGYDKDGLPEYFDLSYLDPYNYLKRPINAMLMGGDWKENVLGIREGGGLRDLLDPFLGPDIAAQALLEVVSNKRLDGAPVYNETASPGQITEQIAAHIIKAIQPGTAMNIQRMLKAAQKETSRGGTKYTMENEMWALVGFRRTTLNPMQSGRYRAYDMREAKNNATRLLSYPLGGQDNVTDDDIRDAFYEMMNAREKAYMEMHESVSLLRKIGLSMTEIRRVLDSSGLSAEDVRFLIRGETPRWRPSPQFLKNARETAMYTSPQSRREFIKEAFKHRKELVRDLVKDYYAQ